MDFVSQILYSSDLCCFFFCFLVLDRVYRSDCSTRQVYEEAAKEVALVVVSGINGRYIQLFSFSLPSPCFLSFALNSNNSYIIFWTTYFQQVFLHMDKQAAERHIQ